MNITDNSLVYQLHADICKVFTSPIRLMLIEQLQSQAKTVSELAKALAVRQATISQHLAVLREKRIVKAKREGQNIFYQIANPKILEACRLMREVLIEQMQQQTVLVMQSLKSDSFSRPKVLEKHSKGGEDEKSATNFKRDAL
jgi:ArsR family transcriptional regulator